MSSMREVGHGGAWWGVMGYVEVRYVYDMLGCGGGAEGMRHSMWMLWLGCSGVWLGVVGV